MGASLGETALRITDVRERTFSIASPISNAYIDFRKMTCSVVAVVTDVVRDGRPVIGFGFNSNGRYAAGGILRDRILPRILEADPIPSWTRPRATWTRSGSGPP